MTILYLLVGIIWLVRLLNHYFKTEEECIIEKYQYHQNDTEESLLSKSYKILGIDTKTKISPEIINRAFYNQLVFSEEDALLDYKPKYSRQDYNAARNFLTDYFRYAAYLN